MEHFQHEEILKVQNLALEKLATGKPLAEIFDALTLGAEENVADAYASVLLLDNSGTRLLNGSAPSFTQALKEAFHGMLVGPLAGSCGTAAYKKQMVIVEDISTDPRWGEFKDFAQAQGLKSCFSNPIIGSDGSVLGTFALTFTQPNLPTHMQLEILRSSAHIASLAIERKRYEENLKLHAKELEEFSLIASHDLQEPLRKIIILGDRLKSRIATSDVQTRDYLDRIQTSSLRMRKLIEDLLLFTKMDLNQKNFQVIDLKTVIAKVLDDLEARLKQTQGKLNLKQLPEIEADPVQMHQLFLNLIGNALKFHREGVPPVVNVDTYCEGNGNCVITVEDNGIGIQGGHINKIFKPFERLHGKSLYEGNGIGLTICKKIVSRHGGKITAKEKSTDGVIFEIILPARQGR